MFFRRKNKREVMPDHDRAKYIASRGIDRKTGDQLTYVIGHKYPLRGIPTEIALKALSPVKALIDKILIDKLGKLIPGETSDEKLTMPVKEIARAFNLLIEAETHHGMRDKWRTYKRVFCLFLEHDIAYRYRFQWLFERLDMDKIKLTDGDKYYFRTKNFRVDLEDEWKDALKKFPQIKDRLEEFKKYVQDCDEKRNDSLVRLADDFLKGRKAE